MASAMQEEMEAMIRRSAPSAEVNLSVVPSRSTNQRCQGGCGYGGICSAAIYFNGYCADPAAREMWIRMGSEGWD